MINASKKSILIAILLIVMIFSFGLYLLFISQTGETEKGEILAQPKTATVLLSPTGVDPKILHIEKGTTVTFINRSANPAWLLSAANELEGFGTAGVINPGQSYSFTYETVGVWSYKEQTYGKFEGTVIVNEN